MGTTPPLRSIVVPKRPDRVEIWRVAREPVEVSDGIVAWALREPIKEVPGRVAGARD